MSGWRFGRLNFRDYITSSEKLRMGLDWKTALERHFLPDAVEDLDSDEEVVRAFFLRSEKKELSARDLLMGPRQFRGQREHVENLLRSLVEKGTLVELKPPQRSGQRGRPQASRYVLATGAGTRLAV